MNIRRAVALVASMVAAQVYGSEWREVSAENVLLIDLPDGRVTIELNSTFAPKTSAHFRKLVRDGFYRNRDFYRVIEGFVAQGGAGEDESGDGVSEAPNIGPEFERETGTDVRFVSVQKPDLFAAETGFVDSFPAARDGDKAWLTHCPGAVAMARGNEPDSGGAEFYIVIGQAPRYLDRNLTVFGRVIDGMDVVQRIRRGPSDANGMIDNKSQRTAIRSMAIASDLDDPPRWQVIDSNDDAFRTMVDGRRKRSHDFFHFTPPEVIDVCQVPLRSRLGGDEPAPAGESS